MISNTGKFMLIAEVLVCFIVPGLFLIAGVILLPGYILSSFEETTDFTDLGFLLYLPASVLAGCLGTVALVDVVSFLLNTNSKPMSPSITLIFMVLGVLAIVPYAFSEATGPFRIGFVASMIATAHIVYLARQHLFGLHR